MDKVKSNLKSLLKELTAINAGVGNEHFIIGDILKKIEGHADEIKVDQNGNIFAIKKGHKPGPSLMLAAHTDEIGLIIRNITANGFLLFEKLGGVPDNLLPGRKVSVGKKNIPGVIGAKPGHLQTPDEASRVKPASACYIDVGCSSREEVEKLGISIGDQVIWQSDFMEMANPDLVATKAVDNRMSCSIVIEMLRNLKSADFAGTLIVAFTVREEAGLYGAMVAGHSHPTDYAIAIDTIPAGDTPDVATERELPIWIGKGPGLPIADGVGYVFFSMIHPAVRAIIETHAAKLGVNLQKTTILSGGYTTDAARLSYAGDGIPSATFAIPRRYSHSPIELVNLNDAVDVYKVLMAIVKDNENADLRFYKP